MTSGYDISYETKNNAAALLTVQEGVRIFAKAVEKLLAGRLAPLTPSCADGPVTTTADCAFTFGTSELRSWLQSGAAGFAVHHGAVVAAPGLHHAKLLTEHMMPFTNAGRPPLSITHGALRDILAGTISDWAAFGQEPGPIGVLAHGGTLNRRVFEAAMELARLDIAIPIERHSSYAQLAHAAGRCSDAIVFGLRPEHVEGAGLVPVLLDGALPWRSNGVSVRCGLPVSLVWNDNLSPASVPKIKDYLAVVYRRLSADARMMSRMERISYTAHAELATAAA